MSNSISAGVAIRPPERATSPRRKDDPVVTRPGVCHASCPPALVLAAQSYSTIITDSV
jgi:hypothetical protein